MVIDQWADLLRPVRERLIPALKAKDLYEAARADWRTAAAVVLADYLGNNVPQLVELNRTSNDARERAGRGADFVCIENRPWNCCRQS